MTMTEQTTAGALDTHELGTSPALGATASTRTAIVDIVIPVYNEQDDLEQSVRRLGEFLSDGFPYKWRITIADNASTDQTWAIASRLTRELPNVDAVHLDQKGRGRALKQVWLASDADVLAYMDVDLSTDLKALEPLVSSLVSGHSDVAIGSRLARGAHVVRGPKREFISRSYNLILRTALRASFTDAQCGFKAIRADVARQLLPLVEDTNWFFDTELLVLAQRAGLRTHEVPVDWVDDPGTTVHIVNTATEDLRGVARLIKGLTSGTIPLVEVREALHRPAAAPGTNALFGQLVRFCAVGVASTAAYFALYLLLRLGMGPQAANLLANLVTAVANTAVNRRLTFGVTSKQGLLRDHIGGLVAFGVATGMTSGALWLLHAGGRPGGRLMEVTVLAVASVAATAFRFVVLRRLMHHERSEEQMEADGLETLAA
ncbi:bifunctional glycosyltransferase family 2/GtrA family protein [Luteococcus sanguinis]|uniref:dolichyl-phosphate beta-glucosyltransferase n=1 Tax=Luteococcus sanguinis TaxID=174038 RepID=A0ABW1X309_9ACTN